VHLRHLATRTVPIALCIAVSFMGLAGALPVQATSHPPVMPAAVSITRKVVLDETSVTAPGFFSYVNQSSSGTVIAWAGTESAHRLKVMTSTDGLHYTNKITLRENSIDRPDVTRLPPAAGGVVVLAWRGTDAAHRLNVLFDVYGSQKKLTLDETSFVTPAITAYQGNLLLAWTGTDANHSLNVLPISLSSLMPGTKTTLRQFSTIAGPNLTVINNVATSTLVLSWTTTTGRLNQATSTDSVHFATALGIGLPQTSLSSPDMLFFQTESGPEHWLTWTGTDSVHHLSVQWTTHFPRWPDPARTKTILPEAAVGEPGLGFGAGLLIAWTGADRAHHLNVARLQGI
jgi:hypothetical protein